MTTHKGEQTQPKTRNLSYAARFKKLAYENKAQMFVEAVVVFPVALVLSLIVLNLLWYMQYIAQFDRIALDSVILRACSPSSKQRLDQSEADIQKLIFDHMGRSDQLEIEVSRRALSRDEKGKFQFSLAPHLQEYTCTMKYEPWPQLLGISFVKVSVPSFLHRTKKIVVDPYRTGVVV